MPDREKVIKGLECCTGYCDEETGCPYYDPDNEEAFACEEHLRRDAIALLKKQEPMKPYKVQGRWFKAYHCSACGELIGEIGGNKINFCYHCGQAVKWE